MKKTSYRGLNATLIHNLQRKIEELRTSESKFRLVFETARDGILGAEKTTKKFLFANPAICELTGYNEKELLKLTVDDIHPKKDLSYVLRQFGEQMRRKKYLAKDLPVLRKDKTVIYCDVNAAPSKIEGKDVLIGFFRDITARKKADEQLSYFKSVVENSSDAIGMSTPKGRHYYQNAAFTKLFGLPVKQAAGKKGQPPIVYADKKVGRDVFKTIMRGDSWTGEVQMQDKNKRLMNIFVHAYAIKDKSGKVIGLVGVHTKLGKKKTVEK